MGVEVNSEIAKIISQQAFAIRKWLLEKKFTEILVPHIHDRETVPDIPMFEVSFKKIKGILSQCSSYFLLKSVPKLKKVFCFTSSFRPETPLPLNCLYEFNYIETLFQGSFKDGISFFENFLENVISAFLEQCRDISTQSAPELDDFSTPLTNITYSEAIEIIGLKAGQDFTFQDKLNLVKHFDSKPVIVRDLPPNLEPLHYMLRHNGEESLNFDVLVPYAGEICGGRELEISEEKLKKQIANSFYFKDLYHKEEHIEIFDTHIKALTKLYSPHVLVSFGFERLMQYLGGFDRISEGVLFPIPTRSGPNFNKIFSTPD